MKQLLFIAIILLSSCQQAQQDSIQKYGFCCADCYLMLDGKYKMLVSKYTMDKFHYLPGCAIDSMAMRKVVASELEVLELMVNELQ